MVPRWRQSSAKAPRRLHEATMVAPRGTTEAPRRPRERPITPSRRLRGATTVASRSLHQFNKPPMQPKPPKGRFHSESVIPSAQPCGVSMFGLGLGLGLELRLCKKMSTAPPRLLRGAFAEPPEIRQIMTSPPPSASIVGSTDCRTHWRCR